MEFWELVNRAAGLAGLISFPATVAALGSQLIGWTAKVPRWLIVILLAAFGALWTADIAVRTGWLPAPKMIDVHDKLFVNERVVLDGHSYRHCTFKNVTFVINGTEATEIIDSDIDGYSFASDRPEIEKAISILNALGAIRMSVYEKGRLVPPIGGSLPPKSAR